MSLDIFNNTIVWLQRLGLIRKEEQENVKKEIDLEVLKEREEKHIWF